MSQLLQHENVQQKSVIFVLIKISKQGLQNQNRNTKKSTSFFLKKKINSLSQKNIMTRHCTTNK